MNVQKGLGRHRASMEIGCSELVAFVVDNYIAVFQLTNFAVILMPRSLAVLTGPFARLARTTSIISCCFGWHFVYWYIITEDNFIMSLKYSSI